MIVQKRVCNADENRKTKKIIEKDGNVNDKMNKHNFFSFTKLGL